MEAYRKMFKYGYRQCVQPKFQNSSQTQKCIVQKYFFKNNDGFLHFLALYI